VNESAGTTAGQRDTLSRAAGCTCPEIQCLGAPKERHQCSGRGHRVPASCLGSPAEGALCHQPTGLGASLDWKGQSGAFGLLVLMGFGSTVGDSAQVQPPAACMTLGETSMAAPACNPSTPSQPWGMPRQLDWLSAGHMAQASSGLWRTMCSLFSGIPG
jgi:hypothetical protein